MMDAPLRRAAAIAATVALILVGCSVERLPSDPPTATGGGPAITRSPSPGPSVSIEPVEGIAAYPGWIELARLRTDDAEASGAAIARGEISATIRHLLISATCTGAGGLTLSGTDFPGTTSTVGCPTGATPRRTMPSIGSDGDTWEIRVLPAGTIDFEVLVEGADIPLHWPPILLGAGDKKVEMHGGCWGISLSWGYDAGDSCGTTIPAEPIETIELGRGEAATVAINGWSITRAAALCGRLDRGAGQPDLFEALADCTVAAEVLDGTVRIGGLKRSPQPWLVELTIAARAPWGDGFQGPFYAYVSVP